MPRKLFLSSVIILVVGIIAANLGNNATYVEASGLMHESMWTPIGALMIVLAAILLLVSGVIFLIKVVKN